MQSRATTVLLRSGAASQWVGRVSGGVGESAVRFLKRARERTSRRGGRLAPAAILVLAAVLCQSFIFPRDMTALASPSTDDLFRRQRQIAREKARVLQRLRTIKPKQRAAGRDLKAAEGRLRTARLKLITTDAQLRSTRGDLDQASRSLQAAEARLSTHREQASQRLVAIYQLGPAEYLDVLTAAVSFSDFANRLYLLQLIVDQDLDLMRAMQRERAQVQAYREQVQQKEMRLAQLERQFAQRHEECAVRQKEQARLVVSLRQKRIYWERALAQMEQDSRDIAAQIRRYQRTPQGRARASTPWTGSFMRPVAGAITSGFGRRMHPILGVPKMHTGIDISAPTGAAIRAGDSGTVIWAAARGGYGLCVVIDHGGGMSTVYGHCSRLAVTPGREVRKGEVIAYVGSTGLSTGPHLHFEVRRNGNPVNPLSY